MIVLVHILLLLGLSVVQSTFTSPADVRSTIKIDRIEDYEDLYVAAKLSIDVFFRDSEIEDLISKASKAGAQLVTTTKDFVRLPPNTMTSITAMDIELNWVNQNQIKALLEQVLDNSNA